LKFKCIYFINNLYHYKYKDMKFLLTGGGKCKYCKSEKTNKRFCPWNPDAIRANNTKPQKHPKAKGVPTGVAEKELKKAGLWDNFKKASASGSTSSSKSSLSAPKPVAPKSKSKPVAPKPKDPRQYSKCKKHKKTKDPKCNEQEGCKWETGKGCLEISTPNPKPNPKAPKPNPKPNPKAPKPNPKPNPKAPKPNPKAPKPNPKAPKPKPTPKKVKTPAPVLNPKKVSSESDSNSSLENILPKILPEVVPDVPDVPETRSIAIIYMEDIGTELERVRFARNGIQQIYKLGLSYKGGNVQYRNLYKDDGELSIEGRCVITVPNKMDIQWVI
jgi:hypothetical protein